MVTGPTANGGGWYWKLPWESTVVQPITLEPPSSLNWTVRPGRSVWPPKLPTNSVLLAYGMLLPSLPSEGLRSCALNGAVDGSAAASSVNDIAADHAP